MAPSSCLGRAAGDPAQIARLAQRGLADRIAMSTPGGSPPTGRSARYIVRDLTEDVPALTAIYNELIATSDVIWLEEPVTVDDRAGTPPAS